MIDNCYIDGISICNRFGVWVTKGGYNGLLAFPAMKEPESNDWPEEDGIEVDLSDPKLEPKEAAVSFLSDTNDGATDLVAYLSGLPLRSHTFAGARMAATAVGPSGK